MATHRFRPRYRGVAWTAVGVGGSLAIVSATVGVIVLPLVTGALGVLAGAAYLGSPTWRLAVTVDDAGLEVGTPKRLRFRLAWTDVVRVVASPTTHTCFVDGGAPERSLLVPGVGAPAPYEIEDRAALVDMILARVPEARIQRVESLDQAPAATVAT
ncbi:MAG: hypothetical protein H0T89_24400 [Deltaproteobacteria bacterium]|nr:hypothetical protein [Deltaproteobacteria bacterium]MDQ3301385.1 hypothetical protein [Myxococcota bacterium]